MDTLQDTVVRSSSSSWLIIATISRVIVWLLTLVTYQIPRFALAVLSYSGVITLEFNFQKIIVLFLLFCGGLSLAIKITYLNRYTKLKDLPLAKDEKFDLHPDVATEEAQGAGFSNYLDEFLSAIKVFGYLEKPVFHELARYLQTKRLVAGDTLSLDSDPSFYIVVDGSVQVFVQHKAPQSSHHFDDDNEAAEDTNLQLLNEVKSGGTLSSLFTILRLFTEDVKLRYEESGHNTPSAEQQFQLSAAALKQRERAADHDVTSFDLEDGFPSRKRRERKPPGPSSFAARLSRDDRAPRRRRDSSLSDRSSSEATVNGDLDVDHLPGGFRADHSPDGVHLDPNHIPSSASAIDDDPPPASRKSRSKLPLGHNEHIIARATVDTTLAVIPAEAFRRLTKKFPNAAAHIVQVILTRLSRVTLLTAHKYLGLTKEIVGTEKAINELACYSLPPDLYLSGGMHKLRQRFVPDTRMRDSGDESDDYFNLGPESPPMGARRPSRHNTVTPARPFDGIKLRLKSSTNLQRTLSGDRLSTSLSSSPESSSPRSTNSALPTPRPRAESASDPSRIDMRAFSLLGEHDFDLREAVMDCISKSIGLLQSGGSSNPPSATASPHMSASDGPLQRAMFNSSFGSLSFLTTQNKDDESSMTTSLVSTSMADLENEVEILYFPQGSTLVTEGQSRAGMFYVIDGFLDVAKSNDDVMNLPGKSAPAHPSPPRSATPRSARSSASTESDSRPHRATGNRPGKTKVEPPQPKPKQTQSRNVLFSVKPGGIAGYLSSLTGYPSYVEITAKTDVYVGFLPARALENIVDRRPIVLLTLAKRLISLISPLLLHIDLALEWMQVNAGQVIYREGESSDSFYMCLQGRLRAISEKEAGGVEIKGEYGQGESVGELDCITATPRTATLHAIRDTELVRMPAQLFNALATRHPSITVQMTRIIASRVRSEVDQKAKANGNSTLAAMDASKSNYNLKTVAILPVSSNIPVTDFAHRLRSALEESGAPAAYLNQASVVQVMGRHAFTRMGKLKLAGWLAETEQNYRIVLFVADTTVSSPWTQTCIRRADCILLVAHGGGDPSIGDYERLLVGMKTTARKELVLLHPERFVVPGTTRPFLQARPWVHAVHHVEMEGVPHSQATSLFKEPAAVLAIRKMREQFQVRIDRYVNRTRKRNIEPPQNRLSDDYARLARRLCGKSVGVVLGGGGARGLSHIGAIRALLEHGVPIDMVGGTSIGSFIGGLYARDADLYTTYGRAKRFSGRLSTLWRMITDLTYPVVAYTTGHEFNRGIFKSFYDLHIEDLWLSFFAVTTNITWSRMEVHTSGYAWRYIRASMSLAGLLPPLCDDGDMLLDGGYFDNLPVSVMMSQGASTIFAVDVGSIDDTSPRKFGDSVSGWWVLIQRWNPWSAAGQIPSITEIQSRLTYLSSVKTLVEAQTTPGVLYMRMPVTEFGTMDFGKFNQIQEVGYNYTKECLANWQKEDKLPKVGGVEGSPSQSESHVRKRNRIRRASI